MHSRSFVSPLLLFLTLTITCIDAVPRQRHQGDSISIPLSATPRNGDDHPAITHQLHLNSALSRQAAMGGKPPLSNFDLYSRILNRIATLPSEVQGQYHRYLNHNHTVASRDHSVPLKIQANDIGYYGTMQLGTPPRSFKLLVDSGSADFWVGMDGCRNNGNTSNCGKHTRIGPHSSSTFADEGVPWAITYGTGRVEGTIVRDTVSVAGFTLQKFRFGVAQTESDNFIPDDVPYDGILGLAKADLSRQNSIPLPEVLKSTGNIAHAVTSYKLPRSADKSSGEVYFGGMKSGSYDPKTVVHLDNKSPLGFWQADMGKITVQGKEMKLANGSTTAILDTGTTLILAPDHDVDAIHKRIPDAHFDGPSGNWLIPCTTNASISISFGGRAFSIDHRDLTFLPVNSTKPKGDCISGINYGLGNDTPFWVLGDVFLKNVYLSTDVDGDKITLAKLA